MSDSEMEAGFHAAIVEAPHEEANWAAFTDWLLDRDDPRGEALRLYRATCQVSDDEQGQRDYERLWDLLASGVCLPLPRHRSPLGGEMVWVPPGAFWMGGGGGVCGLQVVETTRPYFLGVHGVTQAQWLAVMGDNPSRFQNSDDDLALYPVENVSYDDIQEFLRRLNAQEPAADGWTYRLPNDAEREYAIRSPVPGPASIGLAQRHCSFSYYLGRPTNSLSSDQANFNGNFPVSGAALGPFLQRATKVGSYRANGLGLYDLHGNLWEWIDSPEGEQRILRGGGWYNNADRCSTSSRATTPVADRYDSVGFRLARVPPP